MSFSSKKSSLVLILDAQSSVVRGSLCRLTKHERPHIIFSYETPVEYRKEKGSAHLVHQTIKAIKETVHQALRSIQGETIDTVHYVLSSPWILSQGRTVTVEFPKDTKATTDHVIEIVRKQCDEFITEKQASFEIIEEKVFDVRLDGISLEQWHGKKTKKIEVSFAVSVTGSQTLVQLKEACAYATTPERVVFHSALLLQHIAVQQTIPQYKNYTLIHTHGDLTDIVRVHDGTCSFFASYPYGTQTIIRGIANTLKTTPQHAESNLALYEQGSLDASHAHTAHIAIQKAQHTWTAELLKILGDSGSTHTPTEQVLLSAHAHEAFFMHALRSIPEYGTVQRLELDDVRPHIVCEANVRISRMTGLYALAIHSITQ